MCPSGNILFARIHAISRQGLVIRHDVDMNCAMGESVTSGEDGRLQNEALTSTGPSGFAIGLAPLIPRSGKVVALYWDGKRGDIGPCPVSKEGATQGRVQ